VIVIAPTIYNAPSLQEPVNGACDPHKPYTTTVYAISLWLFICH